MAIVIKLSTESFPDEGSFERNRTRCDSSVAIYPHIFNKAYAALHALLTREKAMMNKMNIYY